jgi:predicted metal-dependent hydrolase
MIYDDLCMYVSKHGTTHYIMSEKILKVAEIESLPKLKGGGGTEISSRNVLGYPP